ncbi:MAG: HAD-IA family hydrolase [Chthonomonadales bacterium]
MINCLLWDIDGTLIDTTELIVQALDTTFKTFMGTSLSVNGLRDLIGIPLKEQMLVLGDPAEHGVDVGEMERHCIHYYESNRQLERVIPGSIEALKRGFERGWSTALVTSKNHPEIANTLPRLGIDKYLTAVVTADDVANPKPDPESVVKALALCGAKPGEALFIGDTVHDIRAGQGAGVRTIGVLWGAGRRESLDLIAPDYICELPEDLWSLIVGIAATKP